MGRPSKASTPTWASRARFLREFIARPTMIGAISPSSRRLAEEMLRTVPLDGPVAIAEYGPGTGVFTSLVLERLGGGAKFFAIERNEVLVEELRRRFPGLGLHAGSAADIERFCAIEGVSKLDAVISGLPWASFPESLQTSILEPTVRALKPGGQFVTFAYQVGRYMPAGRRFAKLLPRYFATTTLSRIVWRNMPPAYVIRCTTPG
ncbi:MAG: ribosomal RNA adenine dimethylase domain-containing protein [Planctomycetota bacterium]